MTQGSRAEYRDQKLVTMRKKNNTLSSNGHKLHSRMGAISRLSVYFSNSIGTHAQQRRYIFMYICIYLTNFSVGQKKFQVVELVAVFSGIV